MRNLTTEDINKAKRLNSCGIDALYGAITFLMGSGFKYIAFSVNHPETKFIDESCSWLIYIPKILAFIYFTLAVIRFQNIISELIRIIFISQNEEWGYERKVKIKEVELLTTEKTEPTANSI